jgi:hypothetical protein
MGALPAWHLANRALLRRRNDHAHALSRTDVGVPFTAAGASAPISQ